MLAGLRFFRVPFFLPQGGPGKSFTILTLLTQQQKLVPANSGDALKLGRYCRTVQFGCPKSWRIRMKAYFSTFNFREAQLQQSSNFKSLITTTIQRNFFLNKNN